MNADDAYRRHRGLVFTIAYDITGSVADAEDVAQETYLAWRDVTAEVADPRAYLAATATRRALNSLRTAARRREDYIGPWLPDPLPTAELDPEERAITADAVSMALLVVLQSLSEDERAAFVLHEVFGFGYGEIAASLQRTEASVRQLVSRARAKVRERRPRNEIGAAEHRAVVERFADAATSGDVAALIALMAPDAVLTTDSGGKASAARRPILGPENIARFLLGLAEKYPNFVGEAAELNGRVAMLFRDAGEVIATIQFDTADGLVTDLFAMRNPDKLAHL
ncbi:RNA polymerase sigma factor SigJ [Microbacteriaceae bacterium VKM Ac-2854]|nr:RNA polymerase sigma factor SigJ [Microbacteriaceae bacterium VKM Ac-2854]